MQVAKFTNCFWNCEAFDEPVVPDELDELVAELPPQPARSTPAASSPAMECVVGFFISPAGVLRRG